MRLIDADALMDKITNPYERAVVARWVNKMPTVGGWISVKDEMPELEGDYLVTDGYHVPWKCRLLKLAGVKGWVNSAYNPIINYWMPLPEPPKEDKVK